MLDDWYINLIMSHQIHFLKIDILIPSVYQYYSVAWSNTHLADGRTHTKDHWTLNFKDGQNKLPPSGQQFFVKRFFLQVIMNRRYRSIVYHKFEGRALAPKYNLTGTRSWKNVWEILFNDDFVVEFTYNLTKLQKLIWHHS